MFLSERPPSSTVTNAVGDSPISSNKHECDCFDCHNDEVKPPSHLLFTSESKHLVDDDWEDLCPKREGKSADITVHWAPKKNKDDDFQIAAQEAATEMISQVAPHLVVESEKVIDYIETLTAYFVKYAQIVEEQLEDNNSLTQLKARIVASRGAEGTGCPLWHIDNVPVRWIQALVGPGCEFVTNTNGVNWDAWNRRNNSRQHQKKFLSSVEDINHHRVPSNQKAGVYKAKAQEVALLRGQRWNECRKNNIYAKVLPVVHRSPPCIPSHQGRLLLTQDVVFSYHGDD